jgi:FSR family fosmidomycin resistance protein-like MFS transporter
MDLRMGRPIRVVRSGTGSSIGYDACRIPMPGTFEPWPTRRLWLHTGALTTDLVSAAVLGVRRPWRAPEVTAREDGRRRAAAGRADDWRGFGRLTTVVVLRSVAYFGVASLVALFAIRHFHEPTAAGSAALVTFIGAGVMGTLGGGWLADRWRRVGVLRLGYGVSALALALLVAAPDIAVLFVAAFVLGIVLFAPFAVQVTLGQDFLPNRIGVASGVTLGPGRLRRRAGHPAVRAARS